MSKKLEICCIAKDVPQNVIVDPTTAIHADPDPSVSEMLGELDTGELTPLVCIDDIRFGDSEGLFQRPDAESHIQRRRDFPSEDVTAEPIHDCH